MALNTMLCRRGYVIKKNEVDPEELAKVKKELTVSPYIPEDFQIGKPSAFRVYLESNSSLFLPKSYGLKHFGIPSINKLDIGEDISVPFKGSLRPEQDAPVEAFMAAAYDPLKMGGILNMQCAAGKTVMAIYIICKLGKKAMVIVHKDFLIQQWKERIQEFAPSARIGLLKAKKIDVADKDIVLASLQSLSMKEYESEVFNGFGTLCIDECHHTGAEVFSNAFKKINTRFTLGLSATVKRKDGLSKVFMWHLGDIVFSKKNNKKDVISVHVKTFECYDREYCEECTLFGSKPNTAKMINNICEYAPRVDFIVSKIAEVLEEEPERRILILSDRRGHLNNLMEKLVSVGLTDAGYYYGGMKQEDLKNSEGKKIILGTYSMISEGFDVKGLDTLVLASPKSDIVQSVGRILREKPENRLHTPMVIDIVDDFSLFSRQAIKRQEYYKSCKYDIEGIKKQANTRKLVELEEFAFIDEKI